jgi:3',5'-cyclic AMP phosphodiesterase CpdA
MARAEPVEVYAAGDIADCRKSPASGSAAARTAELVPAGAQVLVPGDSVYPDATDENYAACFASTWGIHRANTLAVPGNHDYVEGRADGFHAYFGDRAGPDGYFARRLGAWLVIGLDSQQPPGDLDRQFDWLESTLEEHRDSRCTLALWHTPLFSSGLHRGDGAHMQRFWALLDHHGAEVVINGHEHFYEAFDPRDAEGRARPDGIREFIVGTGGGRLYEFWRSPFESRARIEQHGVLHLTLADDGYTWEFLGVDGQVADPGAAKCRGPERQ